MDPFILLVMSEWMIRAIEAKNIFACSDNSGANVVPHYSSAAPPSLPSQIQRAPCEPAPSLFLLKGRFLLPLLLV